MKTSSRSDHRSFQASITLYQRLAADLSVNALTTKKAIILYSSYHEEKERSRIGLDSNINMSLHIIGCRENQLMYLQKFFQSHTRLSYYGT